MSELSTEVEHELLFPDYKSSRRRAPGEREVPAGFDLEEASGPTFSIEDVRPEDADLTQYDGGEAIGQRIVVAGRVVTPAGDPIEGMLVEVWQANAGGKYRHHGDTTGVPLDPHFDGRGRCVTDAGGWYRFVTIQPGAYAWDNHKDGWRPAHIHFSLVGATLVDRLITQMYFPGDPLLSLDPILDAVDPAERGRLVADFDLSLGRHGWAMGYRWDIVVPSQLPRSADHHG